MRLGILKPISLLLGMFIIILNIQAERPNIKTSYFPNGDPIYYSYNCIVCDNITNGGTIGSDEIGCPSPLFDPHLIYNIALPTGGTGNIEYQWMYTYENPNFPSAIWNPIANANGVEYDPGPITITTYFMRCSRRSGCSVYSGETNFVKKSVECCPGDILDGGIIAADQKSCSIPYDPEMLINVQSPTGATGTVLYQWLSSSIGGATNNGTWNPISGATEITYDPPTLNKTTYFVRRAKQEFCPDYQYSNIVKITLSNGVQLTTKKTDPSCFEATNGTAMVTVTQGAFPFMYKWSNSVIMTPGLNNLGGGMYKVTVTDATGCSAIATIVLNEPEEISINGITVPTACVGDLTGKINITVAGGIPGYTYKWSSGETTQNLTAKKGGTYTVTVTDTHNCTATKDFTILEGNNLTVVPVITNNKCSGGDQGSIKLSVTGGVPPYTFNWSNGNNTELASNLKSGDYNVTITDNTGCSKIATFNVSELPELTILSKAFSPKCYNGIGGSILVSVSGGKSPYTYKWNVPGKVTPLITNLTAGNYSLTVTDANGCSKINSFTLTSPDDISISGSIINPDCLTGNNGSISVSVVGGASPYTYNWNGLSAGPDLVNLTDGIYNLIVSDSNGCTKQQVFDLIISNDITISSQVEDPYCQQTNGKITLNVTGGTAPYTFIWSNNKTSKDINDLAAGSYSVTVTDSIGCTKSAMFDLSDNGSVDIIANITDVSCFSDSNGAIILSLTGGVAPYTIEWSNGILNTLTLNNLSPGIYSVTVTDKNLCKAVESYTVQEPLAISINTILNKPLCFGDKNGSITATVFGGTEPYTYLWSSGKITSTINDLEAGTYVLTVTDKLGCTTMDSIKLDQPEKISITGTVNDITCIDQINGTIDIEVSGGTLPYLYTWNGALSTQDLDSLIAGQYHLVVKDVNGCTSEMSYIINEPTEINIQANINNPYCSKDNGTIGLFVSGGSGTYTYLWSNGTTNKNLNNLLPGTYEVTVTDALLCSKTASFTIVDNGGLLLTSITGNINCNGDSTGTIEIAVSGGIKPYTYNWSTGTPNTNKIGGLKAGIYSVTVSDVNGCTVVKSFQIYEQDKINISGSITDAGCNGGIKGSINISVTGGAFPYIFEWSNGSQTQNNAGLSAGLYIVTVTDAEGCSVTKQFEVKESSALIVTSNITESSCFGESNGSIDLTVQGGSLPYSFQWSNGIQLEDLNNINAGIYMVTVTDSKLCKEVVVINVTQKQEIIINSTISNPACNGGKNGSLVLTVTGGVAPYTYLWNNGSTSKDLNNIAAGVYSVTVKDASNCTKIQTISVSEGNDLTVQELITQISCNGNKNGLITLTVNGGIAPYNFNWSNGIKINTVTNLGAGIYNVTITDQTGCKLIKSYSIIDPPVITILILKDNISCVGSIDGKLKAVISGGTPPYSFEWSNGVKADTLINLAVGSYSLTVTDNNGCTKIASTNLSAPKDIIITSKLSKTSCFNSNDATIDLSISGGTPPFTFLWNDNATTEDLSGLGKGEYSVTVKDSKGCSKSAMFTIVSPLAINFDVSITDQSCVNQNDGTASVINISGGNPGYSFKWNDTKKSTSATVLNLAPGFYTVTVSDTKACSASKTIEIKSSNQSCTQKIGDYVWLDANKNGIQDSLETGINGVIVHLINVGPDTIFGTGDDILVDTKTTKSDNGKKGYYCFTLVPKGTYVIKFFIDNNTYKFTLKNAGSNDAKDSDVNPGNGVTDMFNVKVGDPDNLTYDAGIYQYCDNITSGGLICCSEILCTIGQVPELIKNVQLASGGSGPIEYLWLYSTKNPVYFPGSPDWIMIPNSNTPSYQPGPLFETTYFIRCAKRADCSNFAGESNVVTKKVVDGKPAQINGAPPTICKNITVNLTSTDYGPGVKYLWELGPGAIPPVATTNNVSVIWAFPGVKTITLYVTYDSCTSQDIGVIVVSNCISLVKVPDFSAIMNEDLQVDLKWNVEDFNDHLFEIERSQDGKSFSAINAIKGPPGTDGYYRIKDPKPAIGDNYYRIKIFDSDANSDYTVTRKVNLSDFYDRSIAVYPNPATNSLTIEPLLLSEKKGTLEISDELGTIKYQKELEAGFDQFNIDISKYLSGTYFVKIKVEGKREITYRIFKID